MPIHRYPGGVVNADNVTPGANQASGVWTLESQLQANGTGFWPQSTSQMSRSLRFNRSDSAYLTRTPAVTGNRRTWTWSGWIKKSFIGSGTLELFLGSASTGGASIFTGIRFIDDQLYIQDVNTASYNIWWVTSAVFRDPSSWYHIVVKYDTTQASSANAVGLWINGISQTITFTAASGGYVQNREGYVNAINGQYLGINLTDTGALNTTYFSGYMTEVILVDGQALDPTYFGYTDSNNVWQPKPYSGSVGTNGFYLTFADNTSNTATGIGKDNSNRGNNWTPVNFSVASGAGNDSLVDVPTNWGTDTGLGGEVRGNYCTFNPNLYNAGSVTYSNGNLLMTMTGNADRYNLGTIAVLTGKWYWELVGSGVSSSGNFIIGICKSSRVANGPWSAYGGPDTIYFNTSDGWSVYGSNIGGGTGTITNGDVIGVALDMDSNYIYLYKNNVLYASRSGSIDLTTPHTLFVNTYNNGSSITLNAGQRPFTYTAPSGFKALCTQNLPTPTIQNGGQYFNAVLYLGNGSTQSITGVGFQPDFVWVKDRTQSANHRLFDAVRGASKILYSSLTNSETTDANGLTSFNSNGFSVGSSQINDNNYNYVAWNWKANGAGSSNTAGSITSTVSVNTTSGFSIVTYTGNATQGATVGHGLGVTPAMLIVKSRSLATDWVVQHKSAGTAPSKLILNSTVAVTNSAPEWNNAGGTPTAFNSTVFTIGASGYSVNNSGATYVAYVFAEVAGYSAFGSYTGNGSADGPFIYTGFRPAYVMIKPSSSTGSWWINDYKRDFYNVNDHRINANSSDAEATAGFVQQDFLSNGFKWRNADSAWNGSGVTYVYAAFAENPFKIARAR